MISNLTLSEELAFCTVRIECEKLSGENAIGTGFFFHFEKDNNKSTPLIVTNKHVIKDGRRGIFRLRIDRGDNNPLKSKNKLVILDDFENLWVQHPEDETDLCVMPVGSLINEARKLGHDFFYRSFGPKQIANAKLLNELNALEEIIMVGYPVGIWDKSNNMPIFRNGITATHPNVDYNGRKEFLIDCACFPGSSGSPVVLYNFGNYRDRKGNIILGTRFALLGILYAGPQFTVKGEIKVLPIPTQTVPISISHIPVNLGFVIKAEKILDFEKIIEN